MSLSSAAVIGMATVNAILGAQLGGSAAWAGVPSATILIGSALASPAWGYFSERRGRRGGPAAGVGGGGPRAARAGGGDFARRPGWRCRIDRRSFGGGAERDGGDRRRVPRASRPVRRGDASPR